MQPVPLPSDLLPLRPFHLDQQPAKLGAVLVPAFNRGGFAADEKSVGKVPVIKHAMQTATGASVWPTVDGRDQFDGPFALLVG